jgi:hypothetical protein
MDGTGNIILSKISQDQKAMNLMFSLIWGYSHKRNAATLLDIVHSKGWLWTEGIGQGKETKHLNVVDVLTVEEQIY